jgi:chromosome partitioning protein
MRTIALLARKGGAGKTTLAAHMAFAAHLRGQRVMLADADPQRSATEVLKARCDEDGPQVMQTSGPKLFALKVAAQRAGVETLIIDTPSGAEQDIGHAMVLADLSVVVVRPTFLDIAAAVQTTDMLRRLNRQSLIVLSQSPPTRAGAEHAAVEKARQALRFTRMPVADEVIQARYAYQTALSTGRSVEELWPNSPAAEEIDALWGCVANLAYAPERSLRAYR